MKASPLTKSQIAILDFLQTFLAEHKYSPSIREIMAAVGVDSTSVMNYQLRKLVLSGYITFTPRIARTIQLTGKEWVTAQQTYGLPPYVVDEVVTAAMQVSIERFPKPAIKDDGVIAVLHVLGIQLPVVKEYLTAALEELYELADDYPSQDKKEHIANYITMALEALEGESK